MSTLLRGLVRNLAAALRMLALRRVDVRDFLCTPEQFVLLTLLSLVGDIGFDMVEYGSAGHLDWQALPFYLVSPAIDLLIGLLLARLFKRRRLLLWWPVASYAVFFWLTLLLLPIEWWQARHGLMADTLARPGMASLAATGWAMLVLLLGLQRALAISLRRTLLVLVAMLPLQVLAASAMWERSLWHSTAEATSAATPVGDAANEPSNAPLLLGEDFLYDEGPMLDRQLAALKPQRPGVADTYLLAVAGDAEQRVFKHEAVEVQKLFDERFGTAGRSLLLINSDDTAGRQPLATRTSIERALLRLGRIMDPGEDTLVLYLTSHGSSEHEFVLSYDPLDLPPVTPAWLKSALDRAGIRWRIVAVSACYSGGFIAPLANDDSLLVTAADSTHPSFGCEDREDFTYFGEAMFNQALRHTDDWLAAFEQARSAIRQRELKEGYEPSNPQLFVGQAMRARLAHPAVVQLTAAGR